ncbi:MAG: hypothetical protein CMC21_02065 [Flavobacteriaceae bacterium]|nr:hypothetical protein [Flavobacteriaceae bacterium]|tara:strand:+ start:7190 stop:7795 length:606 start_codon:yes stop_codon:yes gene_type:complete
MRERKSYEGPVFAFLIFILIGSILVGTPSDNTITNPSYVYMDDECFNDNQDNDNNGDIDFIEDSECHAFPYENGLGEIGTMPGSFDVNLEYQPYYDLSVDYVRDFIQKQCGGNLAGCIGTNFQNEVQFYCFFSDNIMFSTFDSIFDKFFNLHHTNMQNDGSFNAFINTCNMIGPSPTTLLIIEHQQSSPIAENPGGSGGGK